LTPTQDAKLYMSGSSSEVTDIDSPDPEKHPLFASARHVDVELRPGDCLYIPALWPHSALSLPEEEEGGSGDGPQGGLSVAVNAFWRDLPADAYARRDLYSNRDPAAVEAAAGAMDTAAAALWRLPPHYRRFYGGRALRRLRLGLGL
jgi:ribosomal protein L16 Arg81 hydroxylase